MKFTCTESINKHFVVGEVYESTTIRQRDLIGRLYNQPVFIIGEELFYIENRPWVAFNKRGRKVAKFELIIKK